MVHIMRLAQDTIKALAAKKGWTISELLERAGVSRNAYYSLARKKSVIPASLESLAETLEVSPGTFLVDEELALVWANRLSARVERIHELHPDADPDNIRHTLILLEEEPIERLRRALREETSELFADGVLSFLRALIGEGVDFLLVDLSAAALQGAPVVTQDVDLWFADRTRRSGLDRALRRVGGTYLPPDGRRPPTIIGDGVGLFDIVVHRPGLEEFSQERERAVMIDPGEVEVPVLPLDRITANKEATGGEKDRLVLPVLRDVLATLEYESSREDHEDG